MAKITSLTKFKQYIKRKLGEPVINVELDDDQLNDCIEDAVQKFQEDHYDGVDIGYIFLAITDGENEYTLDEEIQDVIEVLSANVFSDSSDPLLLKPFYVDVINFDQSFDLIDVEIWRQNLNNISNYFSNKLQFDYNSASKKLSLAIDPTEDQTIALRVYKSQDDITTIYNDSWLKRYTVALAKYQWGTNLGKYSGANLPGGAEFNYGEIKQEALDEIEKLETELEEKYSEPPDWFFE